MRRPNANGIVELSFQFEFKIIWKPLKLKREKEVQNAKKQKWFNRKATQS